MTAFLVLVPRGKEDESQIKTFAFIQYWMVLPLLWFFAAIATGTVDLPLALIFMDIGMASLWGLYLYGAVAYFYTREYRDALVRLESNELVACEEKVPQSEDT